MFGTIKPRSDQVKEIEFLERVQRGCIWSPPGKGKTLSAAYAAMPPVTLDVPSYLAQKWADWLRRVMPSQVADHVYVATGSTMDRWDRFNVIADAAEDPLHWLLVGHDMLRPEMEEYTIAGKTRKRAIIDKTHSSGTDGATWSWRMEYPLPPSETVIIDEAHWLRGRSASRALGALHHFRHTPRMYQLTATPVYKDADDIFMQLKILYPHLFTSHGDFIHRYMNIWSDGWTEHVMGVKNLDAFMTAMSPWAMRHPYLPGELPPAINLEPIVIEPDAFTRRRLTGLRRIYRDGVDAYATAIEALAAIDRITATSPAKLGALTDWVGDNAPRMDGSRRGVLILCHYRETVVACKEALQKADSRFECVTITGETPFETRARLVENAPNCIGTWKAMSEGIDASHLRLVVPYELDWTYGATEQGIGRVVRQRIDFNSLPVRNGFKLYHEEPVLIQPIHLKYSGDEPKSRRVAQRENSATEILQEICKQLP